MLKLNQVIVPLFFVFISLWVLKYYYNSRMMNEHIFLLNINRDYLFSKFNIVNNKHSNFYNLFYFLFTFFSIVLILSSFSTFFYGFSNNFSNNFSNVLPDNMLIDSKGFELQGKGDFYVELFSINDIIDKDFNIKIFLDNMGIDRTDFEDVIKGSYKSKDFDNIYHKNSNFIDSRLYKKYNVSYKSKFKPNFLLRDYRDYRVLNYLQSVGYGNIDYNNSKVLVLHKNGDLPEVLPINHACSRNSISIKYDLNSLSNEFNNYLNMSNTKQKHIKFVKNLENKVIFSDSYYNRFIGGFTTGQHIGKEGVDFLKSLDDYINSKINFIDSKDFKKLWGFKRSVVIKDLAKHIYYRPEHLSTIKSLLGRVDYASFGYTKKDLDFINSNLNKVLCEFNKYNTIQKKAGVYTNFTSSRFEYSLYRLQSDISYSCNFSDVARIYTYPIIKHGGFFSKNISKIRSEALIEYLPRKYSDFYKLDMNIPLSARIPVEFRDEQLLKDFVDMPSISDMKDKHSNYLWNDFYYNKIKDSLILDYCDINKNFICRFYYKLNKVYNIFLDFYNFRKTFEAKVSILTAKECSNYTEKAFCKLTNILITSKISEKDFNTLYNLDIARNINNVLVDRDMTSNENKMYKFLKDNSLCSEEDLEYYRIWCKRKVALNLKHNVNNLPSIPGTSYENYDKLYSNSNVTFTRFMTPLQQAYVADLSNHVNNYRIFTGDGSRLGLNSNIVKVRTFISRLSFDESKDKFTIINLYKGSKEEMRVTKLSLEGSELTPNTYYSKVIDFYFKVKANCTREDSFNFSVKDLSYALNFNNNNLNLIIRGSDVFWPCDVTKEEIYLVMDSCKWLKNFNHIYIH